jgi:hypothetical protein
MRKVIKHIAYFLAVAFTVSACMTSKPRASVMGAIEGDKYINEYFGFTLTVPEGWLLIDRQAAQDLWDADSKKSGVVVLFGCKRDDAEVRASLSCLWQHNVSAREFLSGFGNYETGVVTRIHEVAIGGDSFSHLGIIKSQDGRNYSIDYFGTDINQDHDALFLILCQDLAGPNTEPTSFMARTFRRPSLRAAGPETRAAGRQGSGR